jgi:hypothetical protein
MSTARHLEASLFLYRTDITAVFSPSFSTPPTFVSALAGEACRSASVETRSRLANQSAALASCGKPSQAGRLSEGDQARGYHVALPASRHCWFLLLLLVPPDGVCMCACVACALYDSEVTVRSRAGERANCVSPCPWILLVYLPAATFQCQTRVRVQAKQGPSVETQKYP